MDEQESILTSIKKLIGITAEDDSFDTDIIIHINTALTTLSQLGAGPYDGYRISDDQDLWVDFIPDNQKLLSLAHDYVYLKVKLIFDPPLTSSLIDSINRTISELEWRITVEADAQKKREEEIQNG